MEKKLKIGAACCLVLLLLSGCGSPGKPKKQQPPGFPQQGSPQQTTEPRGKLSEHMKSGDWKESLTSFKQDVEKNPKSSEAHCALGVVAIKGRDLDLAEKELLLAARLDHKSAQVQACLGWLYAEKKDYPRAEEALNKARALDSRLSMTNDIAAYIEKLKGNYDGALMKLEESQKKEYKSSRSLSLAEIYFSKGDTRKAKTNLIGVLKKDGADYKALTSMGAIFISEKNYILARKVLERSLMLNPNLPATHLNLGVAYMKLKKTKAAIKALEKAVSMEPLNDKSHFYLGQAYLQARDKKKAEREFMQARSLNPDNKRASEALAALKR
jgi:Tfp pilus assembly protein PilF